MFTGLVAGIGRLSRIRPKPPGLRLAIEHALSEGPLEAGESVAVDGCCLTAIRVGANWFEADLSPETLEKTGGRTRWKAGKRVNLERALKVGARLGGHMVLGHVDGLVPLIDQKRWADGSMTARFSLPAGGRPLVVEKGSVALDGVSLTVSARGPDWFEVALIPASLESTTLGKSRVGRGFTVEYDILGKYVLAAREAGDRAGLE